MNAVQKAELVAYKMARAKETLIEAEILINNKLLFASVNRIYYACFYAVNALLINNGLNAKKHSGVRQMLGLHFVTPGIISKEAGKFYTEIFNQRQKGDYEDMVYFNEEEVLALLEPAKQLISQIEQILYKQ